MERLSRFPSQGEAAPSAQTPAQPDNPSTVADLTVRRRYPRRRMEPTFQPDWLPLYRLLKDQVECDDNDEQRERLLLVRRLIACSRLTAVEKVLNLQRIGEATAVHVNRSA